MIQALPEHFGPHGLECEAVQITAPDGLVAHPTFGILGAGCTYLKAFSANCRLINLSKNRI
jgi:hypothetical protein